MRRHYDVYVSSFEAEIANAISNFNGRSILDDA